MSAKPVPKVLFDADVILDVLLARPTHYAPSATAWTAAEAGHLHGLISAVTVTNIYYLTRRAADRSTAVKAIRLLADVFTIVPTDRPTIDGALASPITDFEDAVQHETALRNGADLLLTRNVRDYRNARIPVLTPTELLARHT